MKKNKRRTAAAFVVSMMAAGGAMIATSTPAAAAVGDCGANPPRAVNPSSGYVTNPVPLRNGADNRCAANGPNTEWGDYLVVDCVLLKNGTWYFVHDKYTQGHGDYRGWILSSNFTLNGNPVPPNCTN